MYFIKCNCNLNSENNITFFFLLLILSSTQHGEWPHACLILDTSTIEIGKFVGGASIIAPGVILTSAHKVE